MLKKDNVNISMSNISAMYNNVRGQHHINNVSLDTISPIAVKNNEKTIGKKSTRRSNNSTKAVFIRRKIVVSDCEESQCTDNIYESEEKIQLHSLQQVIDVVMFVVLLRLLC